jgi:hypothetical protein
MSFGNVGETLVPMMIFAIPIIAIVGGISARIARTFARARIQELLIQERIKAIEKGITPPSSAPLPNDMLEEFDYGQPASHWAFGLRVWGAILLAVSLAVMFALYHTGETDAYVWMSIPSSVGLVLLIASFFVPKPKGDRALRGMPHAPPQA